VIFFVNRYGVAHAVFSPDRYTGGYGLGRMECIGDEASLLDCPNAELAPIDTPGACVGVNNRDVGIVCSNTCEDLDWRLP